MRLLLLLSNDDLLLYIVVAFVLLAIGLALLLTVFRIDSITKNFKEQAERNNRKR